MNNVAIPTGVYMFSLNGVNVTITQLLQNGKWYVIEHLCRFEVEVKENSVRCD